MLTKEDFNTILSSILSEYIEQREWSLLSQSMKPLFEQSTALQTLLLRVIKCYIYILIKTVWNATSTSISCKQNGI